MKKRALLCAIVTSLLTTALNCAPGDGGDRAAPVVSLTRIAMLAREPDAELALDGILSEGSAVVIDAGRLAFLDRDQVRVVVVDTAGAVVAKMGRRGGGPGEIQNPRFLARTRDGVGVYDDAKFAFVPFDLQGRPQAELSQTAVVGSHRGIVTGIVQLDDGSWLFSTREKEGGSAREALYQHSEEGNREIAATIPVTRRPVRLPCGIELSGEAPVFTPTLRWAVQGMRVAYVVGAEDLAVIRDLAKGDSLVEGTGRPGPRATEEMALEAGIGLRVQRGNAECELTPAEALRQRGMAERIPEIARVALAPDGALWVSLRAEANEVSVHRRTPGADDVVGPGPFPGLFLAADRFLGEERDSAGQVTLGIWQVGRRR